MIVVFGSINVDLLFGVENLPRPGETVLCPGYRTAAGGKGLNQAVAAARARPDPTIPVRMVGCVGHDGFAALALDALQGAGVDTDGIGRVDRPTGCAAILVDRSGENQITVASGANRAVSADALPDAWLGADTVLVLQMEVPPEANWAVIERAKSRGARVVLNLAPAQPIPKPLIPALDLLVVNEIEALMLARAGGADVSMGREAARAIAAQHGVTTVVSLGATGAIVFGPAESWAIGALALEAVDTVGAGDAFVGGLAVGLVAGLPLPEMLRRASVAAGLACLGEGAAPSMPTNADINERLENLAPARSS
jgi:ribokinase